jgi:glyoxylase-like metal-dependent hydrolase (beta-lactamase superfamily II)
MLEISNENGRVYPVLMWDDDNAVLIDAGYPGQIDAIDRAIADAGQRAGALTDIILTHQDIDHIGCVRDLLKRAPDARVIAHVQEAPYIDGTKTPVKLAALINQGDNLPAAQKAWREMLKTGFENRRVRINQTVSDGEVLPVCGGIEVVHTPGHTPGHICLFLRASGIMVCGDALNIAGGHIAGPNPQYTQDMALGLSSLEKIRAYHPTAVVSYHCGYLKLE